MSSVNIEVSHQSSPVLFCFFWIWKRQEKGSWHLNGYFCLRNHANFVVHIFSLGLEMLLAFLYLRMSVLPVWNPFLLLLVLGSISHSLYWTHPNTLGLIRLLFPFFFSWDIFLCAQALLKLAIFVPAVSFLWGLVLLACTTTSGLPCSSWSPDQGWMRLAAPMVVSLRTLPTGHNCYPCLIFPCFTLSSVVVDSVLFNCLFLRYSAVCIIVWEAHSVSARWLKWDWFLCLDQTLQEDHILFLLRTELVKQLLITTCFLVYWWQGKGAF